jgi:uncharacterized protein YdiU (UPF0061 family)
MSVAGETIDYGPCAFMDEYHPAKVFSSIDEMGRYAYGNQPRIAQWNLARLAETLLSLLAADEETAIKDAQDSLSEFATIFEAAYAAGLRRKLGLLESRPDDLNLAQDLLQRMAQNSADFTLTFRGLYRAAASEKADTELRNLFKEPPAYDEWATLWRKRLAEENRETSERESVMRRANPAVIPRNHRVEEAIVAAVKDDFQPFETLIAALSQPFEDRPEYAQFALPPRPEQVVHRTFCGT